MTNNNRKILRWIIVAVAIFTCLCGCTGGGGGSETGTELSSDPLPVNISIMLDLSSRLIKKGPNDGMLQAEKDTAIIGIFGNWFIQKQFDNKLVPGDNIHIFIYPNPPIGNINDLQKKLTVNMEKGKNLPLSIKNNREKLKAMPTNWKNAITSIYDTVLSKQEWVGSDIFGFFERYAKTNCFEKNHRNILIILTDGYIEYYGPDGKSGSWGKSDDGIYNGISPSTIDLQKGITPINKDLSGLEVMFLEINPIKYQDFNKIESLLTSWCNGMGIKHVEVIPTDLPANTEKAIRSFLNDN